MRVNCIIALVLIFQTGCKKDATTGFKNVKGTLMGAAGCSQWMIQQDNGTSWQPLNLDSFQVTLKGGQPVIFSFVIENNNPTTCMSGETIELTSIQDE
jgi:hypothetical protein